MLRLLCRAKLRARRSLDSSLPPEAAVLQAEFHCSTTNYCSTASFDIHSTNNLKSQIHFDQLCSYSQPPPHLNLRNP
jgi:hypothetical protein